MESSLPTEVQETSSLKEMDLSDAAKDKAAATDEEPEITEHIVGIFSLADGLRKFLAEQGVDSLTGIQALLAGVAMQAAYVSDLNGVSTEKSTEDITNIYKQLVLAAQVMVKKAKDNADKAKKLIAGKSLSGLAGKLK